MTPLEIESKRFAGNVGKCWHECGDKEVDHNKHGQYRRCCKFCETPVTPIMWWPGDKHIKRPTYTIELIRSELERVGKWDGFVRWHVWQLHKFKEPGWGEPAGMVWILDFHLSHSASADILTTPLLLLQAANSYMEV